MNTPAVSEKRSHSRVEVSWPVVLLTSQGATVAETKNIGASGAFILCRAQLSPKEKLRVFVMAPNRNSLPRWPGQIPSAQKKTGLRVGWASGSPAYLLPTASISAT